MVLDEWVIDTDTHITEPPDIWVDRVPARFGDKIPRLVRNDEGVDSWIFGDTQRMIPVGHTAVAGWPEPMPAGPKNMDEVPKAAHDATARLEYMDSIGVWAMALYPNIGGFGNESFLGLRDPALMLACVEAYNDWLLDWISPDPRRYIPIMATPFWDVDATVAEIRRSAKKGHKGILFCGAPQEFGQPYLGDPHWQPLWEAAQEVDLPISFHIGATDINETFNMARLSANGIAPSIVSQTVSLFLQNGIQMTDLLTSGVLPRNPDLRVVVVESGVGWIPFVLESVDYAFHYANMRSERPEYEEPPSEYFRRQVYGCFFHEEHALQKLVHDIGPDRLMFETDYPHPVCLYGNVRDKIRASVGGHPEEIQKKLLWGNAAQLYRVDAPDREWDRGS